jgi:hypothetical protein
MSCIPYGTQTFHLHLLFIVPPAFPLNACGPSRYQLRENRMMIKDRLERIRDRAYALWERAGGGHGAHESHWHQASSEIEEEDVRQASSKTRRKSAPRSASNATQPASSVTAKAKRAAKATATSTKPRTHKAASASGEVAAKKAPKLEPKPAATPKSRAMRAPADAAKPAPRKAGKA